jgi:L-alanine-DL-glutamate epimerase-like enolase superfamily enzyme
VTLPLATPISDAKVLTGRQSAMTEVAMLFVEITTADGREGLGFSYSKRAGGPGQFEHAKQIAPVLLGEDPSDIAKIWDKLVWAGASVGRSGLSVQAIAAFDVALWDLKAKRADLPLAKLLGAHRDSVRCYNTSGGFLHTPIEQVVANAAESVRAGIGGIKIKVGHPDSATDLARVSAVRERIGDRVALMVDANQQWDRPTARRMCRTLERFELVWIEEPLDAYDAEGHLRYLDRHRGDAHQRGRARRADPAPGGRRPAAGRAPDRRDHPLPQGDDPGRPPQSAAGPALRDGDPPAPGRRLSPGAVGGALRLAGAAVQ